MTTKVIESLLTWSKAVRPKQQARRRAGIQWVKQKLHAPVKVIKRVPPAALDECRIDAPPPPKREWVTHGGRDLRATVKAGAAAVASCQVIRFDGVEAECRVKLLDFEMPSVSLPAWVLHASKLKEGDQFYWIMRDSGNISTADIDTGVPRLATAAQMPAAEQAELAELFADSHRREGEGEEWEEYTGNGR